MASNLLLYCAEQWRGDSLGCGGNPYVITPNIDSFAARGIRFSQCYTVNPICGPSRCSLATGWYPHSRGHRTQKHVLSAQEPSLFSYLKQEGYTILWLGKNDMLSAQALRRYVDVHIDYPNSWPPSPFLPEDAHAQTLYRGPWLKGRPKDETLTEDLCAMLRKGIKEPFCIFFAPEMVHPPYAAPEPYASMFSPDQVGPLLPPGLPGKARFFEALHERTGMASLSPSYPGKIRAMYNGMIAYADGLFGRVMNTLSETGLDRSTAVFFFSDHGNYAGDFGLPSKWWTGFEDMLMRVPLIASVPDQGKHGVCDSLVQTIDIFATVLELAGIKATAPHFGLSFLSALKGSGMAGREWVLASSGYHPQTGEDFFSIERNSLRDLRPDQDYYAWRRIAEECPEVAAQGIMLRTPTWKYVWRALEGEELYDLQSDPFETENLLWAGKSHPQAAKLKDMLLGALAQTSSILWQEAEE